MSSDPLDKLREMRPLRDLPESEREKLGIIREGLGRPRKIRVWPERDDYLDRVDELREEAAAADEVLRACSSPEDDSERVLGAAIIQLARETAALAWDRIQAEKRGVDVAALASRRVAGLSQLASLIGERSRVGGESAIDPRDPKLQKIVVYFEELLSESATEALGEKLAESFLTAYRNRIAGWEDRIDPPRVPRE